MEEDIFAVLPKRMLVHGTDMRERRRQHTGIVFWS